MRRLPLRHRMAAALSYRPDGTKARLCFHLQADSYDTDSLIKVLDQLKGFYAGHRVVLLWDGLSAHWSHKMRAHLALQHVAYDWQASRGEAPQPRRSARPEGQVALQAKSDPEEGWNDPGQHAGPLIA